MPINYKVNSQNDGLLLLIATTGPISTTDIESFRDFFDKYLCGTRQFKLFFDLRDVKDVSTNVIKTLLRYLVQFVEKASRKVIATSVLFSNSTTEGIINMIFSFKFATITHIYCYISCNKKFA